MEHVKPSECEARRKEIYVQTGELKKYVYMILGGLIVGSFVLLAGMSGVVYHINYRFSNVDDAIKKMDRRLSPMSVADNKDTVNAKNDL